MKLPDRGSEEATGVMDFICPTGGALLVMRDELMGLEISKASLLIYVLVLESSYEVAANLLGKISSFFGAVRTLEVDKDSSGDLRLKLSNVQGE